MSNGYRIPFEEMLKCSVCQGRIKDARSLPCGHTYCKDCLTRSANATYPPGGIQCAECQNRYQLPFGGAEGLPRCFAINSLLDDINETFGGGDSATLGRHGFQVKETFSCAFCLNLMRDARYLPCGHSFCRECLKMQPRTTPCIKCSKCLKDHNIPARGIDGLPVAYRINSIVAEIRSNDNETSDESQASSSQNRRHQPPHPHRSPDTNSRSLMEDVDEAKRRAQAGNQIQVLVRQINGRTLAINISANATVGDLQREIKTRTSIDQSQQRLTFSGRNLDDKTKTLSSYGIVNLSNIDMNARLRGGSQ
ncbi:uncharacterized protein LOC100893496 [Strongylocentrotus purpuratus]|uniref:Uncharacterized protein n=1 Tax=Strongylocentrotus purpuratus TaxID=7668 RepID=A0A7M7GK29_STRPU|nr:uncharacterized protein LOC100893496 [Strongylocentrotus purpuratus]|eukprot:XP_003728887.1 PREDICTED: uncharacterized protein LOC100893496 [Strongylocentrotus purpuratus]